MTGMEALWEAEMVEGDTKMVTLRIDADLAESVKAIAKREGRTFTSQLERFVRDGLTQSELRPEHFEVDLDKRKVTHTSGVEITYYDYYNDEDWQATDAGLMRNPSLFEGDIGELVAMAKRIAIQRGMGHRRPRATT